MVMRLVDETESWPICQKLAETVSSGAKHGSQIFSARKKRLFRVSDTSLLSASSKTPTAEYWQAGFRHADYFVSCAGRQRAILTGFGGLSAGNETLHKTDAFFILGYNQIVVEFFLSGHMEQYNQGFAPWKSLFPAKSTIKQQTLQTNNARLFDQAMRA